MNADPTFEFELRAWLADTAPASAPAGLHAAAMERARRMSPRRRWLPLPLSSWPSSQDWLRTFQPTIRTLVIVGALLALVAGVLLVAGRPSRPALVITPPRPATNIPVTATAFPVPDTSLVKSGRLPGPVDAPIIVVLPDDRVVVPGNGLTSIASIVDARAKTVLDVNSGLPQVLLEGAELLPDGRVVLVGWQYGVPVSTGHSLVRLLDPATGHLSVPVATLQPRFETYRGEPVVTTLPDGRVLIIERSGLGTCGRHGIDPIPAHLFDPTTGAYTEAPDLPHAVHAAAALADGRVVVAGSWQAIPGGCAAGSNYVSDAWLGVYDPETGVTLESRNPITGESSLPVDTDESYTAAARLSDGRIVLVGQAVNVLGVAPR